MLANIFLDGLMPCIERAPRVLYRSARRLPGRLTVAFGKLLDRMSR